jgi:hypothetical protein
VIFIITERLMNGTVTAGISTSGLEANNFEEAADKFVLLLTKGFVRRGQVGKIDRQAKSVSYSIDGTYLIVGEMTDEPLNMVKVDD